MSTREPDCGHCQACAAHYASEPTGFTGIDLLAAASRNHMILCATCGNKRCPHATDHRLACTGSNEPNQPGSSYQQRYLGDAS